MSRSSAEVLDAEGGPEVPKGARVGLVGLQAAHLNGKVGTVRGGPTRFGKGSSRKAVT